MFWLVRNLPEYALDQLNLGRALINFQPEDLRSSRPLES
jgi:hypothetical protein